MQKVEGEKKGHDVKIYALSTCMWCKKTKKLLDDNSVEYEFEDVDLLQGSEREDALSEIEKLNPKKTFPTIAVDGKGIIGFKEDELKEALGL